MSAHTEERTWAWIEVFEKEDGTIPALWSDLGTRGTPLSTASDVSTAKHAHIQPELVQMHAEYVRELDNARTSRHAFDQTLAKLEGVRTKMATQVEEHGPSIDIARAEMIGCDRGITAIQEYVTAKDWYIAQLESVGKEYGW